jgi:hypothetical protein
METYFSFNFIKEFSLNKNNFFFYLHLKNLKKIIHNQKIIVFIEYDLKEK